MSKIDTAVFLAAGLGSRLKELGKNKPKGFLEIGGSSLIERSVKKLQEVGIQHFFFGTGYHNEAYNELAATLNAQCIKNEIFASTGSMYTLYNMRDKINSDFLLLEADLLYDKSGLEMLISDPHTDAILASGTTHSDDEVFIETDPNSNLINMSKNRAVLHQINAELVGISKVSLPTYRKMCTIAESRFQENPKLDYEYVFVELSKSQPVYVLKKEGYIWCEIDDASHYKRAEEKILPFIK